MGWLILVTPTPLAARQRSTSCVLQRRGRISLNSSWITFITMQICARIEWRRSMFNSLI